MRLPRSGATWFARRLGLCLAAVLATLPAAAETASGWVEGYNSRVRLIAGAATDASGLVAGVHIVLAPGWKTYWRNPGDSGGVPPHFDWSGSANLEVATVLYPAPLRLKDATGDAVGYMESVVFPVMLRPLDRSRPIELRLAMEYGICREICIPAEAKLQVRIEPGALKALPGELAAALAKVPREPAVRRPGDPQLAGAKAVLTGDKPRLELQARFPSGTSGADVFVEAPEGIYIPLPQRKTGASGNLLEFQVDLSTGVEPQDLKGKRLLLTLVSDAGSSEATWTVD
jgi:DsbC/DsbD-like thiol-disulfide interchange protein